MLVFAGCGSAPEAGTPIVTAEPDGPWIRGAVWAPRNCHERLTALGLDWTEAAPELGIAEPVRVGSPIRGVDYRYSDEPAPRAFLMDCGLAVALAALSDELRARFDAVEVVHLGIYNYRCIGGGTPDTRPGCTLSQHAYARAIDLNTFVAADGTTYGVETDWVIDAEPTCAAPTESVLDAMLHDIACGLHDAHTFNVILTPNYNAAHRNHFHVDLTADDWFIRAVRPATVDPELAGLGD